MNFHFSPKGSNRKLGKMPVSTSSKDTCPPACPHYNSGCYGRFGPLAIHWGKVSAGERGCSWKEFLDSVRAVPAGAVWRHNQAGDLAGKGNKIDLRKIKELTAANKGRNGYTYTHKPLNKHNIRGIKHANKHGFTINVSATGLKEADKLKALDCGPVATTVLSTATKNCTTPAGNKIVICPAISRGLKCEECRLCANPNRKAIIGFPAHGTGAKKVDAIIKEMDS